MKHIIPYEEINERLGVPEGNIESAMDLSDQIIEKIEEIKNVPLMSNTEIDPGGNRIGVYSFPIDKKYTISDKRVDGANIDFIFLPDGNEIILSGLQISNPRSVGPGYFDPPKGDFKKSADITLQFIIPEKGNPKFEDLLNFIKDNETEFSSSIAHELKHFYDSSKRRESFSSVAKYKIPELVRFGIPEIDNFIFNFYLTHKTESLVRPSEMAAVMKKRGIKKQEFLDFFNNEDVVKKMRRIGRWTYEGFKEDLLDRVGMIKMRLDQNHIPYPKNDKEVVELILNLLHKNILKAGISEMEKFLSHGDPSNFLRRLISLFPLENPETKRMREKMEKEDYNDFYRDMENYFKKESNTIIRKLAKLYDLAEDNTTEIEEKNSSIRDMEAHWKIKGVSPRIKDLRSKRK